MNNELMVDFISEYPAQPATAFWRAIEIDVLCEGGLPDGLGLDLGCGDGKLTRIITDRTGPRKMIGIDYDPLETEAAEAMGLYEEVHTCPAAEMPLEDNQFDWAISNSVLEHIPDLEPVIKETSRVLKSGAKFIITVPTIGFHKNLSGPVKPGASRASYLKDLDKRIAHFHYHSEEDWRKMFDRNDFDLELSEGYLDRSEVRRWETLSRMTGGLLYAISGGKARPIFIQRKLGLRAAQNRGRLPRPAARAIAGIAAKGFKARPTYRDRKGGLPDNQAGCLYMVARRR